ncbi:MAG: DUF4174 domain-containing protein [Cyclobacteriaceae bacterium]
MVLLFFYLLIFFQGDLPVILSTYDQKINAIVIFAPDNRSAQYMQSITNLTKDPLGLDQRNILIFEIFKTGGIGPGGESLTEEQVTSIREYYLIDGGDFSEVLVTNNFREIHRSDVPVDIKEVFRYFDQIE